jgi:hypothetical protein
MMRFSLKSPLSLALVFGLACAVPAITTAQAQEPRDAPNTRNINDPANARNLNDPQDPNRSRLNDPANARNLNDPQDPNNSRAVEKKTKKPNEQ